MTVSKLGWMDGQFVGWLMVVTGKINQVVGRLDVWLVYWLSSWMDSWLASLRRKTEDKNFILTGEDSEIKYKQIYKQLKILGRSLLCHCSLYTNISSIVKIL